MIVLYFPRHTVSLVRHDRAAWFFSREKTPFGVTFCASLGWFSIGATWR